jgi:hypothetical protein
MAIVCSPDGTVAIHSHARHAHGQPRPQGDQARNIAAGGTLRVGAMD